MKTLIFQHTDDEKPGTLEHWLKERNHPYFVHKTYAGGPDPDLSGYEFLVVLGGPMNVDDEAEFPWLKREKVLIADWLRTGKHYLGICLGGQLLAQVAGGKVSLNKYKEIGFHPVQKLEEHPALRRWPSSSLVFQWHQDTFSLPSGSRALITSSACANQAFALDARRLGLQFHPEATSSWIAGNYKNLNPNELENQPYVQSEKECMPLAEKHLEPMRRNFFQLLDDLVTP